MNLHGLENCFSSTCALFSSSRCSSIVTLLSLLGSAVDQPLFLTKSHITVEVPMSQENVAITSNFIHCLVVSENKHWNHRVNKAWCSYFICGYLIWFCRTHFELQPESCFFSSCALNNRARARVGEGFPQFTRVPRCCLWLLRLHNCSDATGVL